MSKYDVIVVGAGRWNSSMLWAEFKMSGLKSIISG